eukprot:jgi/Botrbrau1/9232/Bobra.0028s0027.1
MMGPQTLVTKDSKKLEPLHVSVERAIQEAALACQASADIVSKSRRRSASGLPKLPRHSKQGASATAIPASRPTLHTRFSAVSAHPQLEQGAAHHVQGLLVPARKSGPKPLPKTVLLSHGRTAVLTGSAVTAQPGTPKGHAVNWAWEASLRDPPEQTMLRRTTHTRSVASKAIRRDEQQTRDFGLCKQQEYDHGTAAESPLSGTRELGMLSGRSHDPREPKQVPQTGHSRQSEKQASSSEGHISRRLEFAHDDLTPGNGTLEIATRTVQDRGVPPESHPASPIAEGRAPGVAGNSPPGMTPEQPSRTSQHYHDRSCSLNDGLGMCQTCSGRPHPLRQLPPFGLPPSLHFLKASRLKCNM